MPLIAIDKVRSIEHRRTGQQQPFVNIEPVFDFQLQLVDCNLEVLLGDTLDFEQRLVGNKSCDANCEQKKQRSLPQRG